jgi:hypothetical protein
MAAVSAAAFTPANAMTVGTSAGIQAGIAETGAVNEIVYVCRHRYSSSRRVCYWRPGGSSWRPWRRWRRT